MVVAASVADQMVEVRVQQHNDGCCIVTVQVCTTRKTTVRQHRYHSIVGYVVIIVVQDALGAFTLYHACTVTARQRQCWQTCGTGDVEADSFCIMTVQVPALYTSTHMYCGMLGDVVMTASVRTCRQLGTTLEFCW
jgi:hypothetical protein